MRCENVPRTPGQHITAPGLDPSNDGHAVHTDTLDEPLVLLNVPAGHNKHDDALLAPVMGLYVPAGHGTANPCTQYWPTGHGTPNADVLRGEHKTPSPHRPSHVAFTRPTVEPKWPMGQSYRRPLPGQYEPANSTCTRHETGNVQPQAQHDAMPRGCVHDKAEQA